MLGPDSQKELEMGEAFDTIVGRFQLLQGNKMNAQQLKRND
jgi:hypothetical protein